MNLNKGISFWGVFSIATGAMISSGIFILPGLAYSLTGPAVFLSYFIAGILGLIGIFSIIELATAMPKAGGDYFFINKTFGPLLGTLSGMLGWFALSLKSTFAIFGISEIIFLYTNISPLVSGFVLVIFFVILNCIGVKEAAVFQISMVAVLLFLLIIFIITGLPSIDSSRFSPLFDKGINTVVITSGFIFISFGGLLTVANIAEEVKKPEKNIPAGIISSILVVTVLYTLINVVITGTLSSEAFSASLTPVADSAKQFLGNPGYIIILVASSLAFFTTANAGIMAASRYPMALSVDKLLPPMIGSVSSRLKTPVPAIILTGVLIYLSILLPLEMLVKAASTVILTSYVLTNLAVIVLRESKITNYRPSFRTPLYPIIQIVSIILFSFFIIDMGIAAIELSVGVLSISALTYLLYGRKKAKQGSALLHLLSRIVDTHLLNDSLEDELREIVMNRENIEKDNFDTLIQNAEILEIEGNIDFNALLEIVSTKIAESVNMGKDEIIQRFLERQSKSNTALSKFLAIPHIVLEGENKMFLLIVRAKNGIRFTKEEDSVKAVFFIGGSAEKKVLHLKTIAAIATMIGDNNFISNWVNAKDAVDLKNLMLLSKRRRFL